jgi:hypothetical protein
MRLATIGRERQCMVDGTERSSNVTTVYQFPPPERQGHVRDPAGSAKNCSARG